MDLLKKSRLRVSNWYFCSPYSSVYLSALLLILAAYGWRLSVLEVREFDQDEFAHFHYVWCVAKGMLPYRDFFEHHTPWFHFLFAQVIRLYDVETSVADAFTFIFFSRQVMWLFTGIILFLTFYLGRLCRNSLVGLVGTLFLINTDFFLAETLEFRPDLLSTIFWLACMVVLVRAIKTDKAQMAWTQRQFFWSGILLGAAIMTTQKVLLAVPGLAIGMSLYALTPSPDGTWRTRFLNIIYQACGVLVPFLFTMAYFYLQNSLGDFIKYNFFFNLGYPHDSPYGALQALTIQNPYLVLMGSAGLVFHVLHLRLEWTSQPISILVFACLGLIAGLFLIPNPYPQYYLMFLPLLSLLAGMTIISMLSGLTALRERVSEYKWIIMVAAGAIPIGLFLAVFCRPHVAAFWFGALLIAAFFTFRRAEVIALTVFLFLLSIPPHFRTYSSLGYDNTAQLEGIRYVTMNTAATDTVMDGFTGSGAFRPHAYFYFMLHAAIRSALSPADWNGLLADLQTRRISPKLIIFDMELRALPATIIRFFEDHYRPTGHGDIWERNHS